MAKCWIDGERWIDVKDAEGVNTVHLTVDDKEIAVSGGQTILEAVARMPGSGNIPPLCYHPAVQPYGACRICTVEASEDGGSKFKFVAACLYPVKEGLLVKTNTERVKKLRQEIIGKSAISMVNRGIYREVAAPFYAYELSGDCIGCGDCAYVCPTGAIKMGPEGKPVLPKVKIPYAEIEAMMKKETVA